MITCADGRSAPLSLIHPVVWSVLPRLTVPALYSLSVGWIFFPLLSLSLFADYMLKWRF